MLLPTIFTHAVAGAAIAQVLSPLRHRTPLTVTAAVCALLPDADALGTRLGISYGDMWGHRGVTHSLVFAAMVAVVVTLALWRRMPESRPWVFACIYLAAASHPLLDAFTNGGLGVALLAPFDDTRYFSPVRPIRVSPMGVHALFTRRFVLVLVSEFVWVWVPALVLMFGLRRLHPLR